MKKPNEAQFVEKNFTETLKHFELLNSIRKIEIYIWLTMIFFVGFGMVFLILFARLLYHVS